MSSRKNVLTPHKLFNEESMAGNLESEPSVIQWLDNVSYQLSWTGNPTGTFQVQGSLDYVPANANQNVPAQPGTWIPITLNPVPTAAGTPNTALLDLNQLSFPYVRLAFVTTFVEEGQITAVADVDGSLNSTYFLIDGADGDDWYVWFDNGSGVDPDLDGRTGVSVSYTDNATASTLGGLIRTALGSVTSLDNITGAGANALYEQSVAGSGDVYDSEDAPTGFSFSNVATSGLLTAYVSAKMV